MDDLRIRRICRDEFFPKLKIDTEWWGRDLMDERGKGMYAAKLVFVFIAAEYETPQNALNQVWNNGHGGCKGPTVTFLGRSRAVVAVLVQILFVIGNRHQVSLWDGIIPSKEHAKFSVHTTNKYRFKDQVSMLGSNLRGKEFNLTLHWHVMPKTGKITIGVMMVDNHKLLVLMGKGFVMVQNSWSILEKKICTDERDCCCLHAMQYFHGVAPHPMGRTAQSFVKSSAISLFLLSTILFFFLVSPTNPPPPPFPQLPSRSLLQTPPPLPCSSVLLTPTQERCSFSLSHCNGDSSGLFNYAALHFCFFAQYPFLSVLALALILLFHFYVLVKTAQDRFSVVVTQLASLLNLSPSKAAVTLLALGNGSPDVFASVAAVRGGQARTGFGAILSAGTFVSALVVGFVAIYAAPFAVDPSPFIRDVFFYLVAAFFLFYVYLSAEIYLWQAVGFVGLYVFFVGFVFWMDVGVGADGGSERKGEEMGLIGEVEKGGKTPDFVIGDGLGDIDEKPGLLGKISLIWEVPVATFLKLTIPSTVPSEWSRFYRSANIVLCPLAIAYSCRSFFPLDHRIVFLLPNTQFPLWAIILFSSFSLGLLHYKIEKVPPESEGILAVFMAFIMSVFWISTVAGELLDCLAAVGVILKLPPSILGMTVLAWGNSVGDLVADVALAKAGQPAMAMAGCFAGPMFNMLVGLGSALVIQTFNAHPNAFELHFNLGIVVAFVFLFLSLMGSLLVVTWHGFRVPRFWGFCLVEKMPDYFLELAFSPLYHSCTSLGAMEGQTDEMPSS
ncbi:hypothetical protein ACLOJK_025970 [Asimina triloba]